MNENKKKYFKIARYWGAWVVFLKTTFSLGFLLGELFKKFITKNGWNKF